MAVIFLTAMFGAFLLQVFSRYILNEPLGWTVEACVILYIWTVFWTAAFLLKERDHVAFTMVYDAVSPPKRRIMAFIGVGLIGAAFIASLPAVIDYVTFMKIDTTPVTRIRFDLVYSIFVIFVIAVGVRAILTLKRLCGPNWRHETGDQDPPEVDPSP